MRASVGLTKATPVKPKRSYRLSVNTNTADHCTAAAAVAGLRKFRDPVEFPGAVDLWEEGIRYL